MGKKIIFNFISAAAIIACASLLICMLSGFDPVYHEWVSDFTNTAISLNLKNLVTAVYLGPRIFDTFLEVMVIVLTVYGIKFIRTKE